MAEINSDVMAEVTVAGKVADFYQLGGPLLSASAVVSPSATQASGDTANMVRLPSTAVIKGGKLQYDGSFTSGGTATVDVGLFSEGGTDDADLLLNDVDIETAAGSTDVFANGTAAVADQNKALWELLGLSSDPGGYVDVKVTFGVTLTAAGALKLVLDYTAN